MIEVILVLGFTLVVFGLYSLALVFSRYRQRRPKDACQDPDHRDHRCAHCTCDIDLK